jgi:hypothetical protein
VLLPNADVAEIDPQKLWGYVLSLTHPIGRFKARFFAALGYSAERWAEFEADLRAQHLTQDAQSGEVIKDGQIFTIRTILQGPNGQSAAVRSVWFIAVPDGTPRFVTAYPEGSK